MLRLLPSPLVPPLAPSCFLLLRLLLPPSSLPLQLPVICFPLLLCLLRCLGPVPQEQLVALTRLEEPSEEGVAGPGGGEGGDLVEAGDPEHNDRVEEGYVGAGPALPRLQIP